MRSRRCRSLARPSEAVLSMRSAALAGRSVSSGPGAAAVPCAQGGPCGHLLHLVGLLPVQANVCLRGSDNTEVRYRCSEGNFFCGRSKQVCEFVVVADSSVLRGLEMNVRTSPRMRLPRVR